MVGFGFGAKFAHNGTAPIFHPVIAPGTVQFRNSLEPIRAVQRDHIEPFQTEPWRKMAHATHGVAEANVQTVSAINI